MVSAPPLPQCTGVYRGVVTIDVDPLGQYRVKAKIPQLLGDDESDWCRPAFPVGMSETPSRGDAIWLMFEGGDPAFPVYVGSWMPLGVPVLTEQHIPAGAITSDMIADFAITLTKFGDTGTHHFDTPALTSNSPSPGYVSWGAFRMVYNGVTYNVVAGNTNNAYIWWTYGSTTLTSSNTPPSLTVSDCLMILNKSGTAFLAPTTQVIDGSLIVTGSIGTNQLAANSITATQIAAGAINGMTITGATITGGTIQTATSGRRIVLAASNQESVKMYSGQAGETPGVLTSDFGITYSDRYTVRIATPYDATHTAFGYIDIASDTTGGTSGYIKMVASSIDLHTALIRYGSGDYHGTNYINITCNTVLSGFTGWTSFGYNSVAATVVDNGTIYSSPTFQSQSFGTYTGTATIAWAASATGFRAIQWLTDGGTVLIRNLLDMSSGQLLTRETSATMAAYLPGGGYGVTIQGLSSVSTSTTAHTASDPCSCLFTQVS